MTGKLVNPLKPTPDSITIRDIAWSLSRQARFIGHQRDPFDEDLFYNNAQHSLLVSQICETFARTNPGLSKWSTDIYTPKVLGLLGLFHDATEAYLSDIFGPSKKAFRSYLNAEGALHYYIHLKLKLPLSIPALVKSADKCALVLELSRYQKTVPINFDWPNDDVSKQVLRGMQWPMESTMKPSKAYHAFIERYLELTE